MRHFFMVDGPHNKHCRQLAHLQPTAPSDQRHPKPSDHTECTGSMNILVSLTFKWFSEVVAESSRKPLGQGERHNESNHGGGHSVNNSFVLERFHADSHPLLKSQLTSSLPTNELRTTTKNKRALVEMMSTAMSYCPHALDCQMKHNNWGSVVFSLWMGLTIIIVDDSRICSPPVRIYTRPSQSQGY
jgi:hypothetical protein